MVNPFRVWTLVFFTWAGTLGTLGAQTAAPEATMKALWEVRIQRPLAAEPVQALNLFRQEEGLRNPGEPFFWTFPGPEILGTAGILLGAGTAFFLILSLGKPRGRRLKRWWILGGASLMLLAGAGAWDFQRPDIGVLRVSVTGRLGDGEYSPQDPTQKWKPGQDSYIIARQRGWVRLQVGESRGWVPAWTLEQLPR